MSGKIKFEFTAEVWQHSSPGGWYFISVPKKLSKEMREYFRSEEEGWGRLKAIAKIGNTEWETAIWFDTKANAYFLPLKSDIRKKEKLEAGKKAKATLMI
jgi:hypothetical protein